MKRYGRPTPPEYNLLNVRTKVHILHGSNDLLSMDAVCYSRIIDDKHSIIVKFIKILFLVPFISKNIPYLASKLENAHIIYSSFPYFNHFDFAFGRHVGKVSKRILKIEKKFAINIEA